jgi:hypothetical protein
MLRRTSGRKRDEVTGRWRRLHKEDKLCGACSTHGRENPNRRDHSDAPGKVLFKLILGKQSGKVWTGCIRHSAQDRDHRRAPVNTATNLGVP